MRCDKIDKLCHGIPTEPEDEEDEGEGEEPKSAAEEGGGATHTSLGQMSSAGAGDADDKATKLAMRRVDAAANSHRFGHVLRSKGYVWLSTRTWAMGEWSQAGGTHTRTHMDWQAHMHTRKHAPTHTPTNSARET